MLLLRMSQIPPKLIGGVSVQTSDLILQILEDSTVSEEEKDKRIHLLLEQKISENTTVSHQEKLSISGRAADAIAKFVGSWTFIFSFAGILIFWIAFNVILLTKPVDPYPFILLNLMLSMLAAIQAPVIMMSQNRQEEKDRMRAKNDYLTNLKSEIILEDIYAKIQKILEAQEQLSQSFKDTKNEKEQSGTEGYHASKRTE